MSASAFVEHELVLRDGLRTYCREYVNATPGPKPAVLCLPGITRNCRDFEDLAPELAKSHRVLTPDFRGRGRSEHDPQWLRYQLDTYIADVVALLDHFGIERVIIIGTSLGGLVGLCFGARFPARLLGLVLNDIGPQLDPVGMQRIGSSVGESLSAPDWAAAAARARLGYAAIFPEFDATDWLKYARRIYREVSPGRIERDMDPNIAKALGAQRDARQDFWPEFRAIASIPTLCLRGAQSDLLASGTLQAMGQAHHRFDAVTIAGRGHTPTLDEPESRRAINGFLGSLSAGG